jgi:hypothetical protein
MAAEFSVARLALVPTHLAITIVPDIGGRGSPVAQHLHSVIAELRDARAYRQRHEVDVRRRPQHRRVATARWSIGIGDHRSPAASSTRIQCSLACYVVRASIPALIADYWTLAGSHRCTIRLVNAGSSCIRDRT